jgi:predicted dehydrogenase
MVVGLGFLGCGSAFEAYARQVKALEINGKARPVAAYDVLPDRRVVARAIFPMIDADATSPDAVIEHPDVDAVIILTSIPAHADLTVRALGAGKHVLAEKPMATSLADGARVLAAAEATDRVLVCGPHVTLSPTFRDLHDRVRNNDIGPVLAARARYGWRGPDWADWYYKDGGGAIFDLGIYNLVSLCGLIGPVRNVSAMVGTAVRSRPVQGRPVDLEVEDTAQIILDFGGSCFAVMTTGNVMQSLRSPAIELYGETGVLQLLGEDYAPAGFERWHLSADAWEVHRETDPLWPWTDGMRHMVDCIELGATPVMTPSHAYHVLEVALAAKRASAEGRTLPIESTFPPLNYIDAAAGVGSRFHHDVRIV